MKREPVASQRDTWLERLMRRPAAHRSVAQGYGPANSTPGSGCLDADTLAAWADGALQGKELAAAELHASQCSRCLAVLAAIERTAPPPFA